MFIAHKHGLFEELAICYQLKVVKLKLSLPEETYSLADLSISATVQCCTTAQ